MTTAVQTRPDVEPVHRPSATDARVVVDGKFLRLGAERFLVKGVTYGTFAPDDKGYQFPDLGQLGRDFRQMAGLGINTVRVYTPPHRDLLDLAADSGLRVMVGIPWSQHVAFLDDRSLRRAIRRELTAFVRELGDHPAAMLFALGNEIPAGVIRWHGRLRVERFLRSLYEDTKAARPDALLTYVNFPPTEFLDLSFFDVCAFNVYLHREHSLRAYVARLQHVAGHRPFLLAEAGADSIREGTAGQAAITATHIRTAFEEGACGAVAFAWTDEWWRGGFSVDDWAFGLVDRARQPKPAADAVRAAFADAPFPNAARAIWPRVSVIVCAYNAADTLDDNLSSLERLDYPDYEIILVNDGSRDRTGDIARAHPRVHVIDIPNGGLSAARNVGLAAATGEIVAYTDADTRVDRDWLTFLVQPFLVSDVVGSGGPNVVPADDPPMAQCIARAPGAPTHVLLDDRIAEHVPGCNMAFRRAALLAIDGFNPVYLRAGDDVDVCWRLQARGGRIGFASAALVWHHHRSTVGAYWRQQVGYGEGERWLMAHHPEKFLGGHMLWHGRIYSPLPFVRSIWGERVNTGVWGTAAFPSVYRTDLHPFAFLPHSVKWQLISLLLLVGGGGVAATGEHVWTSLLLLGMGAVGIVATVVKNATYALRSDVGAQPGRRLWYRAMVASLHFIQPFARMRGQIRGILSPPEVSPAAPTVDASTSAAGADSRPHVREAWRALLLVLGSVVEDRYWSETWTSAERFLGRLDGWLRRSRGVARVEVDDGWADDRDVSILVGRWAWLDVRALVEEHGSGRCLLRVSTHLRPTSFGIVAAGLLASVLLVLAFAGVALRWPVGGGTAAAAGVILTIVTAWRTARASAVLQRGVDSVARQHGMIRMRTGQARVPLVAPSMLGTYGLRSMVLFVIMLIALGTGSFLLREAATAEIVISARRGRVGLGPNLTAWVHTPSGIAVARNGTIYFADSHNHLVWRRDPGLAPIVIAGSERDGAGFYGDGGPATKAQLNTPDGVCVAPDGDLVVADAHNHRIRRIDRETGLITTIAGTGDAAFSDEEQPALNAPLNTPEAVACAPNGDVYIADTLNDRIGLIDHQTGALRTVAGNGSANESGPVGDGGPAVEAQLYMPSDVALAPNGDIYIADMHHNRVRKVDARTQIISTVAGTGVFGREGDGGPATSANFAGPSGLALAPEPDGKITLFIADYYNGLVRAVGPDGKIRSIADDGRTEFGAPTRLAFEPRAGWLYVNDSSKDQVVAINLPRATRSPFALLPRTPVRPASPRPAAGGAN